MRFLATTTVCAFSILTMVLMIVLCGSLPAAELGTPTWAKSTKATPGTMTDVTITVPVTKVSGRESVSCTVHLIAQDGQEITHAMVADIVEHDGPIRQTIQMAKVDAQRIAKLILEH